MVNEIDIFGTVASKFVSELQNAFADNKEGKNGDSFNMVILSESDHVTIAAKILAASLLIVYQINFPTHNCASGT